MESGVSFEVTLKAVEHPHHRGLLPTSGELPYVIIRRGTLSMQDPILPPQGGPYCETWRKLEHVDIPMRRLPSASDTESRTLVRRDSITPDVHCARCFDMAFVGSPGLF